MPPVSVDDEDDFEVVPIPLDRETRRRLVALAREVRYAPAQLASSLLHDLLKDDEDMHTLAPRDVRSLNS
jgi:hypothetical protein